MEEQLSNYDQSSDVAGYDFFLNVDLFDELMGSLARVYQELYGIEDRKQTPDSDIMEIYSRRYQEILLLKESFPINAVAEREKATDHYSLELKHARLILQQVTDFSL